MGRTPLVAAAVAILGVALIALSAVTAVSAYRDARATEERTLSQAATAEQQNLTSYFERARALTELLAQNPAFAKFQALPGGHRVKVLRGAPALAHVNTALAQMEDLTRGVGEACLTADSGEVSACAVGDEVRPIEALWPDYSWTSWFKPALRLAPGQVHQTRAYVSQSNYFVIASATPIELPAGEGQALVHVETPIESFRQEAAAFSEGLDIGVVERADDSVVFDTAPGDGAPVEGSAVGEFIPSADLPERGDGYEVAGHLAVYDVVESGPHNANDWLVVARSPNPAPGFADSVGATQIALLAGGLLLLVVAVLILRVKRRATEETDRVKGDLLGLVSHELRTPLTSIVGYTELLAELEAERLSEQGRGFLDVIARNANRELRLVGDLLVLQQIDGGKFSIHPEPVELAPVVEGAIESVRARAGDAGVELRSELGPVGTVSGDSERLGQVLDNLLSNAIKYSPEGGTVDVRLYPEGDSAVIEVADTGLGIPEKELDRLFERMFRATAATELHIPGVGLGLSIVKAIVDAHGGRVSVASRVGEGTTFRVELPAAPKPVPAAANALAAT